MTGLLGADTAEQDSAMLSRAFVNHLVMKELIDLRAGFHLVVGRRGAGKSAIQFKINQEPDSLSLRHEDFEFRALTQLLRKVGVTTYQNSRTIARIAWRIQLALTIGQKYLSHFKARDDEAADWLRQFCNEAPELREKTGLDGVLEILRQIVASTPGLTEFDVPELIATRYKDKRLSATARQLQEAANGRLKLAFDGLDDGWLSEPVAAGVIGGLVLAVSDLTERLPALSVIVFLRDSMLRSLAVEDPDYARNIEGNTIRLDWTKEMLLQIVTERLKQNKRFEETKPLRIWNKFTSPDLQDTFGFEKCLKKTLFRPRDIIQLINDAYRISNTHGRERISEEDITQAAHRWSRARLDDLSNEYSDVFPGLGVFISKLSSGPNAITYNTACSLLDEVVQNPSSDAAGLSGLFSSGKEAVNALFSIGLLGTLSNSSAGFCYDGSPHRLDNLAEHSLVVVHPCYWAAMQLSATEHTETIEVDDGYDVALTQAAKKKVNSDVRIRLLGRRAEELRDINEGEPHKQRFTHWLIGAIRTTLSEYVNPITTRKQQSKTPYILATNRAKQGVIRSIAGSSDAIQIAIFPINSVEIDRDTITSVTETVQADSLHTTAVLMRRGDSDEPTDPEKSLIRKSSHSSGIRFLVLSSRILEKALKRQQDTQSRAWLLDRLQRAVRRHEASYWKDKRH